MDLPKLTKPNDGHSIWFGRILIHLNFAKTLIWSEQQKHYKQQRDYLLSIHIVKRNPQINRRKIIWVSALCIIIGPIKIMIGISD